jgi:hypothetical protein
VAAAAGEAEAGTEAASEAAAEVLTQAVGNGNGNGAIAVTVTDAESDSESHTKSDTTAKAEPARDTAVPTDDAGARTASSTTVTLDEALSAWSSDAGRAWARFGLGLAATWLQGTHSLREAQRAAAERAEAACLDTGKQLETVSDWQRAAMIQADFLREQVEEAVNTAVRLGEIARDSTLALATRTAEGWGQAQLSGFNGMRRWAQVQAALPTTPEVLEAEAEHVTNPLAAMPMVWPAQEAVRQGMGLASSFWNDWVESTQGRVH